MTFFSSPVMGRDRSRTLVVAVVMCNLHVAPAAAGAFPSLRPLARPSDGPGLGPFPLRDRACPEEPGRSCGAVPSLSVPPPVSSSGGGAECHAATRPTMSASMARIPAMDPIAGTRSSTDCHS